MTSVPWAGLSLGNDPSATLRILQEGLPVRLIATDRSLLQTCGADEELAGVVQQNRNAGFDHLPVTISNAAEGRNRIVGLVELVRFTHGQSEAVGRVRDVLQPLSEENIIGADASIMMFLRDADRHQCRLVVSGPQISGIVTLADIQRLPVRAALFAMVTHLELIMSTAIRSLFGMVDDWIGQLSTGRQSKLKEQAAQAKAQDAFVDLLLYTQFCDKVTIIGKSPNFPWRWKEFEGDLNRIQALRDNLAHANDYANTRDAAIRTCETVRIMDMWIERLTVGPAAFIRAS